MRNNGVFTDVGMGVCYLAFAAVIVAANREPLAHLISDMRQWWNLRHPVGKMWDDVRSAASQPTLIIVNPESTTDAE